MIVSIRRERNKKRNMRTRDNKINTLKISIGPLFNTQEEASPYLRTLGGTV